MPTRTTESVSRSRASQRGQHVFSGSISSPSDNEPKWNRIFPGNTTRFRETFDGGELEFSPALFESFIANWEALGKPDLPVDYWHEDRGIAAGWISDLRIDAAGNLEALIEFTSKAREMILSREVRFISPSFVMNFVSPLTGKDIGPTLLGAGVTNIPFLQDLPPLKASRYGASMDFMKKLCAALGIAQDSTEEQLLAACVDAVGKGKSVAEAMSAETEKAVKLTARVGELEGSSTKLEAERAAIALERDALAVKVARLEAENLASAVRDLVRESLDRGVAAAALQVEKAMKLARNDVAAAREIVEMIPGTVATKEVGLGTGAPPEGKDAFAQLQELARKEQAQSGISYSDALEKVMLSNKSLSNAVKGK